MEVVFMVQLVRLLSSFIFSILVLMACSSVPKLKVDADLTQLHANDGLVYKQNQLYTGETYALYPETSDTLSIANYTEGKADGEWKRFYEHHLLLERRFYKNGAKTGKMETWWPNGKLQKQYFFKDDEYQGTCREWNQNGQLIQEMNYENGYEVGMQKMFYDNGKVRCNYLMINGRRYGLLGTKNCTNVSDSVFVK